MRIQVWRSVCGRLFQASVKGLLTAVVLLAIAPIAHAQLYWDMDGATAGAGGATPTGVWNGTNTNWSTSSTGNVATGAWVADQTAVFSAGSNATGAFTVTVVDEGSTRAIGVA